MGFFKDVGNAIKDAGQGIVNNIAGGVANAAQNAGANIVGSIASAAQSAISDYAQQAYDKVLASYIETIRKQFPLDTDYKLLQRAKQYMETPAGKALVTQIQAQLSAGASILGNGVTAAINNAMGGNATGPATQSATNTTGGTTLGGILSQIGNAAIGGIANGVQNGLGSAISDGIKTVAENLGASPTAGTVQETLGGFGSGILTAGLKDFFKRNWFFLLVPGGIICMLIYRSFFKTSSGRAKTKTRRRR